MVNCQGSLGTFLENAKIYCYQLIDHEYQLGQGVCFVSYVTLLLFEKKKTPNLLHGEGLHCQFLQCQHPIHQLYPCLDNSTESQAWKIVILIFNYLLSIPVIKSPHGPCPSLSLHPLQPSPTFLLFSNCCQTINGSKF